MSRRRHSPQQTQEWSRAYGIDRWSFQAEEDPDRKPREHNTNYKKRPPRKGKR